MAESTPGSGVPRAAQPAGAAAAGTQQTSLLGDTESATPPPTTAVTQAASGRAGKANQTARSQVAQDQPAASVTQPVTLDPTAFATAFAVATAQINQDRNALTPTVNLDKTVPDGCYLVDGNYVNAWGKKCDEPAHVKAAAAAKAAVEADTEA